MTTPLHQLEVGAKSAEQIQEELDKKIIDCYDSMKRMSELHYAADGMFKIFKLHFLEDLKRMGKGI